MNVVSEIMPIISLLKVNHLELPKKLYGNVPILKAVTKDTQKEECLS